MLLPRVGFRNNIFRSLEPRGINAALDAERQDRIVALKSVEYPPGISGTGIGWRVHAITNGARARPLTGRGGKPGAGLQIHAT